MQPIVQYFTPPPFYHATGGQSSDAAKTVVDVIAGGPAGRNDFHCGAVETGGRLGVS